MAIGAQTWWEDIGQKKGSSQFCQRMSIVTARMVDDGDAAGIGVRDRNGIPTM